MLMPVSDPIHDSRLTIHNSGHSLLFAPCSLLLPLLKLEKLVAYESNTEN